MNKTILLVLATTTLLAFAAYKATVAEESNKQAQAKSVAWYVANIKAARQQNQLCHDDPSIQASEECQNSLHALQIAFTGGN